MVASDLQGVRLSLAWNFQSPSLRGSGRFASPPPHEREGAGAFQSPSLRGSGRFGSLQAVRLSLACFQSPSLRGSGRFEERAQRAQARAKLSIPFIAGQWSLRRYGGREALHTAIFQSPSLRGSGRFILKRQCTRQYKVDFQSPSLRGSGRFKI